MTLRTWIDIIDPLLCTLPHFIDSHGAVISGRWLTLCSITTLGVAHPLRYLQIQNAVLFSQHLSGCDWSSRQRNGPTESLACELLTWQHIRKVLDCTHRECRLAIVD